MRVAASNAVNLSTNTNGSTDDAYHRKGERAPHQARGHQCSLARNPGTDPVSERRLGTPRMRKCGQETLARNLLGLPTEDKKRPHCQAKCWTPGMRFALRMRGEWNEETRVDTARRRCATMQKTSRRWPSRVGPHTPGGLRKVLAHGNVRRRAHRTQAPSTCAHRLLLLLPLGAGLEVRLHVLVRITGEIVVGDDFGLGGDPVGQSARHRKKQDQGQGQGQGSEDIKASSE